MRKENLYMNNMHICIYDIGIESTCEPDIMMVVIVARSDSGAHLKLSTLWLR